MSWSEFFLGHSRAEVLLPSLLVLVLVWVLSRLWLRRHLGLLYHPALTLSAHRHRHHFVPGGLMLPIYCSSCHSLLLEVGVSNQPGGRGLWCTDCGLALCNEKKCFRWAQKEHECKQVTSEGRSTLAIKEEEDQERKIGEFDQPMTSSEPVMAMAHHLVRGNLPLLSECSVCGRSCGDGGPDEGMMDAKCCWCQRTVHEKCQPELDSVCDLGEFADLIIPPNCVTAKSARTVRQPRRWIINKVVCPPPKEDANQTGSDSAYTGSETGSEPEIHPAWRPLIVIGNTKAGNNDGAQFLNAFRGYLNPAQVIDLNEFKVEDGLHWCDLIPKRCIVLVAGGDGTIGWVLNTIDQMKLEPRPLLALLPLGTGNDLGRSLGYGAGGEIEDVRDLLRRINSTSHSEEILLDRWRVNIVSPPPPPANRSVPASDQPDGPTNRLRRYGNRLRLGQSVARTQRRTLFIQNYLSVGVDALVTYNFHKTRESQTMSWLSGRLFNKLLYFVYGTKDVLERECKDLQKILELHLDGRKIDLPALESVVVLNIPSWGAGVRPWELGSGSEDFPQPRMDDGRLEVFAIYSSFHIAQMQVGLSEPHRIGQAKEVKIVLKGNAPIQADGEPWIQKPAEITVSHHNQIPILKLLN